METEVRLNPFYGALNMAMGVGSTLGAFALAARLKASIRLLVISAAVFAGCMILLSVAPNMALAMLGKTAGKNEKKRDWLRPSHSEQVVLR